MIRAVIAARTTIVAETSRAAAGKGPSRVDHRRADRAVGGHDLPAGARQGQVGRPAAKMAIGALNDQVVSAAVTRAAPGPSAAVVTRATLAAVAGAHVRRQAVPRPALRAADDLGLGRVMVRPAVSAGANPARGSSVTTAAAMTGVAATTGVVQVVAVTAMVELARGGSATTAAAMTGGTIVVSAAMTGVAATTGVVQVVAVTAMVELARGSSATTAAAMTGVAPTVVVTAMVGLAHGSSVTTAAAMSGGTIVGSAVMTGVALTTGVVPVVVATEMVELAHGSNVTTEPETIGVVPVVAIGAAPRVRAAGVMTGALSPEVSAAAQIVIAMTGAPVGAVASSGATIASLKSRVQYRPAWNRPRTSRNYPPDTTRPDCQRRSAPNCAG